MTSELSKVVRNELALNGLDDCSGVFVGYSGGRDSTALAIATQKAFGDLARLIWVDHGIRAVKERERERDHVRAFAHAHGFELLEFAVDPGRIERDALVGHDSIEACARRYRYGAFRRVIGGFAQDSEMALAPNGWFALAVAHHRNDQTESVLMRLAGGHGPDEPLAIPRTRVLSAEDAPDPVPSVRIFRPFLDVDPSVLVAYLRRRGVSWIQDSTNRARDYRRNRIRSNAVPALEEDVAGAAAALARFGERHAVLLKGVGDLLERLIPGQWGADDRWQCRRDDLEQVAPDLQMLRLRPVIYGLGLGRRIDTGFARAGLRAMARGVESTTTRSERSAVAFVLSADSVGLTRYVVRNGLSGYLQTLEAGDVIQFVKSTACWSIAGDRDTDAQCVLAGIAPGSVLRDLRASDRWIGVPVTPRVRLDARRHQAVIEDAEGLSAVLALDGTITVRDGVRVHKASQGRPADCHRYTVQGM